MHLDGPFVREWREARSHEVEQRMGGQETGGRMAAICHEEKLQGGPPGPKLNWTTLCTTSPSPMKSDERAEIGIWLD